MAQESATIRGEQRPDVADRPDRRPGRRFTVVRLVLRAATGVLLVATPWLVSSVPADTARRIDMLLVFGWFPVAAVLESWTRRRPHRPLLCLAVLVDVAAFVPVLVATDGPEASALAVLLVPVVMVHAASGPRCVVAVGTTAAFAAAAAAEIWTDSTVIGPVGFVALTAAFVVAQTYHRAAGAERARVSDQLERHHGRTEAIVTGVAEGVVVTTARGRIDEWNTAAAEIFSCHSDEAIGRSCSAVLGLRRDVTPLDCSGGCAALRDADGRDLELWRPRENGDRQPLLVNASPIVGPGGVVREVVHSFRDITDLRRADEAKTMFLATASHELKTPLAVIRGYSELLLHGDGDDTVLQRDALEAIHRRSIDLSAIVERLLMSSRIEAGRVELEPAPGDLRSVLIERTSALASSTGRAVFFDHDPHAPMPLVLMTSDSVATVVDHLLENAAKYSPAECPIDVGLAVLDEAVAVTVRDEGIGLTPEQQVHCFDKFWQGESSDVRRFGGTGIGLYIVRALVDALGGTVSAASGGPGTGSAFTFSLRRADAAPSRADGRAGGGAGEESIIREFMRQVGVPTNREDP